MSHILCHQGKAKSIRYHRIPDGRPKAVTPTTPEADRQVEQWQRSVTAKAALEDSLSVSYKTKLIPPLFFWAVLIACGSSQVRDRSRDTAVTTPNPEPLGHQGTPPKHSLNRVQQLGSLVFAQRS